MIFGDMHRPENIKNTYQEYSFDRHSREVVHTEICEPMSILAMPFMSLVPFKKHEGLLYGIYKATILEEPKKVTQVKIKQLDEDNKWYVRTIATFVPGGPMSVDVHGAGLVIEDRAKIYITGDKDCGVRIDGQFEKRWYPYE